MKRWKRSMRISALSLVLVILSACGGQPAQPQQSVAPQPMTSDSAATTTATAGIPSSPGRIVLRDDFPPLTAEQIYPLVERPMLDWDKLGITGNPEQIEIDPNENIYVQEFIYAPRENEPGKYKRVKNNIVKVSADGTRLWAIEVPLNVFSFCGDANGLWVLFSDENELVYFNENGQEEKRIEVPDQQADFYFDITYADGYICCKYSVGDPQFMKTKCLIINVQTNEMRTYDPIDARPGYTKVISAVFPCEGPYFCTLSNCVAPFQMGVQTSPENIVDIMDARTGEVVETRQLRDKDNKNMQVDGNQGHIVYSAKEKRFYFRGGVIEENSTVARHIIYSQAREAEYAEKMTDIPTLTYFATPFNLLGDELIFFEAIQMKTFTIDKNYHAIDQQKKPLVVQGGLGIDVITLFSQQNPGWEIKGTEISDDNTAMLLRQDSTVDVYLMEDSVDIDALVQNGYYVDLSKSKMLQDKISAMYPVVRDAVSDGKKLWGYPADHSYESLYVNAGYTGTIPNTWNQLKDLLRQDPKLLPNSIGDVKGLMVPQADVASGNMNAAERKALWRTVLDDLSAYNAILPKTSSGEFNASAVMNIVYPTGDVAFMNMSAEQLKQLKPVPALSTDLAGKTQIIRNSYFVVNPYGKNIDMAMAFLETYAQSFYVNDDIAPIASPQNDKKEFFDTMMKDAYIYHTPSYYKNLSNIVTSYLEGQLTQEAALEEIESIYRLAQRG